MNDNKELINFSSITYATKARNLLMKSGINSDILKTPKTNGKSTCGYSLFVSYNIDEALNILRSKGFKFSVRTDSDNL